MKKILLPVIFAAALFASPRTALAQQAPTLGTAASFVLFSSTGAVGNTGALSHFTGDIGTVVGAITINVNVNGVLRYAGSAASAQAALDVFNASHQLDTTTPTYITPALLAGVDSLGGNHTMYAGVDSLTQNTLIDSTLTLDAQGNPNAVFIFKINGTLSSTSAANIVLANGAVACNVFWQTSGAVSLGAGSIMRGTIITKNATINMNDGATLEGRALTVTAGAITATNVITYTPTGCGSPVHLGPAAANLASAACYALFSTNGTVSNAGISNLVGDVGTNGGTAAGYNPLNVNGTIHPAPDSSTTLAATDLNNAHTYLFTRPVDIELLYPAQFGHNLVLTPHTYLLNAATAITDTLYLNAEGNPAAVFVIKVVGALSTSVKARVILINGTQASNVFWDVEGALSISDSAIMRGSFIVNNGAITMTTGALLDGRALTTTGALSTAAVTATIPPGSCLIGSPLPLGWLSFSSRLVQGGVRLDWAITSEINNATFLVERSIDGRSFEALGTVAALSESGKSEYHYSLTDALPYANGYYRLSHLGLDGRQSYYRTIQVNTTGTGALTASAYVGASGIQVQISGATPGSGTVLLYAADGRKVAAQQISITRETSIYTLDKPWQKGLYLLYITSGGQKLYSGKVIVD